MLMCTGCCWRQQWWDFAKSRHPRGAREVKGSSIRRRFLKPLSSVRHANMNSPTTSPHWPTLPKPLQAFFAKFPLYTYPPVRAPVQTPVATPTLWILPPANTEANSDLLSANIECLKWQAYLALRGLRQVQVRWDVHPDGAIDAHLPNLHVPVTDVKETIGDASSAVDGQLLAAKMIPEWVDGKLGAPNELEGYVDSAARDESRAWVSLLEGHVQKMLVRTYAY